MRGTEEIPGAIGWAGGGLGEGALDVWQSHSRGDGERRELGRRSRGRRRVLGGRREAKQQEVQGGLRRKRRAAPKITTRRAC